MILTISEAARRAGVARATLYEMKREISPLSNPLQESKESI
jgi:hypothetical protein